MGIRVCIIQPGMVNTAAAQDWERLLESAWSDEENVEYGFLKEAVISHQNSMLRSACSARHVALHVSHCCSCKSPPSRIKVSDRCIKLFDILLIHFEQIGMESVASSLVAAVLPDDALDALLNFVRACAGRG